ncbi:hypothetical protein KCA24_31810, partial [Escherichia coli]|nr:hypothetical protein [Escherichia coli]
PDRAGHYRSELRDCGFWSVCYGACIGGLAFASSSSGGRQTGGEHKWGQLGEKAVQQNVSPWSWDMSA